MALKSFEILTKAVAGAGCGDSGGPLFILEAWLRLVWRTNLSDMTSW